MARKKEEEKDGSVCLQWISGCMCLINATQYSSMMGYGSREGEISDCLSIF